MESRKKITHTHIVNHFLMIFRKPHHHSVQWKKKKKEKTHIQMVWLLVGETLYMISVHQILAVGKIEYVIMIIDVVGVFRLFCLTFFWLLFATKIVCVFFLRFDLSPLRLIIVVKRFTPTVVVVSHQHTSGSENWWTVIDTLWFYPVMNTHDRLGFWRTFTLVTVVSISLIRRCILILNVKEIHRWFYRFLIWSKLLTFSPYKTCLFHWHSIWIRAFGRIFSFSFNKPKNWLLIENFKFSPLFKQKRRCSIEKFYFHKEYRFFLKIG